MKAKPSTVALILTLALASASSAAPTPQSAPSDPKGAAAPSAPGAPVGGTSKPTALAPEQMKMLDDALGRAEGIVKDVEYMRNGDGSGCPASFTVRRYMQDLRAKRISRETGDDLLDSEALPAKSSAGTKLEWEMYYICQALASKSAGACAEAGSVTPKTLIKKVDYQEGLQDPGAITNEAALAMQQSQSYEGKCTLAYHRIRASAAYSAKAASFMDICREALPRMADVKDQASGDAICRAWQSYDGNPEPFLAAIQRGVRHPFKREYALDVVREMTLAPGVCRAVAGEDYRALCREEEDFRRAFQTKDIGACRGGICRVLMGDGLVACEAYARRFKTAACTQHYAVEFVADQEKEFKRLSDQVENFLSESDAGIGDSKQVRAVNARIDRLYDLRDRFDRAADAVAPKTVPRRGAGPKQGT